MSDDDLTLEEAANLIIAAVPDDLPDAKKWDIIRALSWYKGHITDCEEVDENTASSVRHMDPDNRGVAVDDDRHDSRDRDLGQAVAQAQRAFVILDRALHQTKEFRPLQSVADNANAYRTAMLLRAAIVDAADQLRVHGPSDTDGAA